MRMAFRGLLLLAFSVGPVVAASGAYFQESGQTVTAGNAAIQLVFNAANGGLVNLIDQSTGQDFLAQKNAYYNGFTFAYITPANSTLQYAGGYLAQSVTFTPVNTSTGIQVTIQFSKFTGLNISATLTIAIDNVSSLTTWNVSISNQDQITIQLVGVPYLSGLSQMSVNPANDYFAYPSLSGMLFQDPVHNFVLNLGWGYQQYYPGGYGNMQFMAYYSLESGAGLYIASQDTAGYTKYLEAARPNNNWLEMDHAYVPTFAAGSSVTVPYPVVVGFFNGDWFDAATLYRTWAIQQPWAQGGPLVTRVDVPDWYKKSGMMAWMLTVTQFAADGQSYADLAKVAAAWQQDLQSQTIMDWTEWENQGAWLDIPNFLPPSQGWPAFESTVSATHAAGSTLMVEPSTSYATVGAPGWSALQSAASLQVDGTMYLTPLSTLNQSGENEAETVAQMDPTQAWHDAILSFTTPLQQNGIDLIHMDGNPYQRGLCYAPNHSHPPGGGNWWFEDLAQIYSDVRSTGRAANPNFAMGGEFYAEPYIGLTDSGQDETNTGLDPSAVGGGSVSDNTKVSYIPLWQAVYHDYTLTYSMLSFIDGSSPSYYRRGLAIPLAWGEIPMIFGENSDGTPWLLNGFDQGQLQYLRRIASLRTGYGYRFVVLGRMLRPPAPVVPAYTIPAVEGIPYTLVNTSAFNAPSVLSSAWQSPEGDAALIFTNISDSVVPFSWTVSPADVPLQPAGTYNLYILRNGSCTSGGKGVHLPHTLDLSTAPSDVVMALFSRSEPPVRCSPVSRPR
jgi:hypothetical protein